jgi:hypothetical protein
MQGYAGDAGRFPRASFTTDIAIRFFYMEPELRQHSVIPTPIPTPAQPRDSLLIRRWQDARLWWNYLHSGGMGLFHWPPSPSPRLTWTFLGPQWGRFPSGHFGPEISFARQALKDGLKPAIFKYSKEATSLALDWRGPGEGGLYDDFTRVLGFAMGELRHSGYAVNVRGLVWVQGESDAGTAESARQYLPRLQGLIRHLRDTVLGGRVPVVLGADEAHPAMALHPEVAAAQESLAAREPCVVRSSMRGLEKADATHLTPAALEEHGQRLYESYRKAAGACFPAQ